MNYLEAVKLLNKSADIKKSGDDLKMQSDIIRKNAIDIINCHIRNGSDKIVNKNGYSYLDDSYDADKSFRRCYFTQDKDGKIDVFNIREGVKLSNSQNITFDREFIYNDNSISEIRIKPSKKQNTFTCNRSYKYAQDGRLIRVIDNPVYNRNALIQSFKTDYSYDKNGISTVRKGYKQIKEKSSYDKILYYNNNSINSIVIQNGNTEKTYNYNQDGTLHHFIRHKKLNSNSDNLYHQDKFIVFDKNNTKRKK